MRLLLSMILCSIGALACTQVPSESTLEGSYIRNKTLTSRMVNVCWRDGDARTQEDMDLVSSVVTNEYRRAGISFTGWTECPAGAEAPAWLVVAVQDQQPYARFGCKEWSDEWCVRLNFRFNNWPSVCATDDWENAWACHCTQAANREICIQTYALHEFAHAAGLAHEADRPDSTCSDKTTRDSDAEDVGPYDPNSITNYCGNKQLIVDLTVPSLSDGDIATLEEVYRLF